MHNEIAMTALGTKRGISAKRMAYLIGGHVLLGLGFIGMVLPLMPTTVFWIVAAACYSKSSPARFRRLIGRGRTGRVIKDFLDHGVISARGKWAATLLRQKSIVVVHF